LIQKITPLQAGKIETDASNKAGKVLYGFFWNYYRNRGWHDCGITYPQNPDRKPGQLDRRQGDQGFGRSEE
jgi:hypothetical protein